MGRRSTPPIPSSLNEGRNSPVHTFHSSVVHPISSSNGVNLNHSHLPTQVSTASTSALSSRASSPAFGLSVNQPGNVSRSEDQVQLLRLRQFRIKELELELEWEADLVEVELILRLLGMVEGTLGVRSIRRWIVVTFCCFFYASLVSIRFVSIVNFLFWFS